jgi:hypothetical protein
MRLTGNPAEVGECCAEWGFKSKSNYAFQQLGNSICGPTCEGNQHQSWRGGVGGPAVLEVWLGGGRRFCLCFHCGSGNLLILLYGKQHVVAEMMAPVNPAAAQIEK